MDWKLAQSMADDSVAQWNSNDEPGGGIMLFDETQTRVEAFGGLANLEFRIPFSAQSVVRLASVTKHVVASVVLKCVDQGILSLDEGLNTYLPQLTGKQRNVSIRGALDMTGGLPDMIDSAWMLGVPRTALLDCERVLAFLASIEELNFKPGDEFSYSNAGYRLVEAAMEARGITLEAGIREHLFDAFGVHAALPRDQADVVSDLAPGYWFGPNGWRHGISGMPYCGADGQAASAEQFVVWLKALLAGRGPARGLLERLAASAALSNGRETGVGLGIANSHIAGHAFYGFVGGLPGYRSAFLLSPELKLGMLAVANREDADVGGAIASVFSALLGARPDKPTPTETLPDGMFVTSHGPDWLEINRGYATFLGTQSFLHPVGNGQFDSNAFYSPMRLRQDGDDIVGEVGHRFRRFQRISSSAAPSPSWAGEWRLRALGGIVRIDVDGTEARIVIGSGPATDNIALTPLDERRALFERAEGPRRQRVCLSFSADGRSVLLATQRSRVLRFERS
ncbi:D-aminopeptidase [Paraburkholderia nemoris]|uniref:serine hydrolase domain-containing protein n=1 Tax=Paraburkholderia nemoris TaxID=2793076 RepID=UPI00190AB7D6|nr:serine hydrolase domain-containing protein [Paraburkholderia nemoris]MBK3745908.1 beta-lactamase family protein [Paraburkholderia aspalathi]CAE6858937.1 D-aminopeptidase [Paraburkholderia nemoris]